MRRLAVFVLASFAAAGLCADSVAFTHVTVIDMTGAASRCSARACRS